MDFNLLDSPRGTNNHYNNTVMGYKEGSKNLRNEQKDYL